MIQGQAVEALGQELRQRVIHEAGFAGVVEAGGQRAVHAQRGIDLAEQEDATGTFDDDSAVAEVGKEEGADWTVCHAGNGRQSSGKPLENTDPNALSHRHLQPKSDRFGFSPFEVQSL